MSNFTRAAIFATMALALSGCPGLAGLTYRGDGHLADHGVFAYSQRYEIDLGAIDSTTTGSRSFNLAGLPHAQLYVGVEVVKTQSDPTESLKKSLNGQFSIVMTNGNGEVVMNERGQIQEWDAFGGIGFRNTMFSRRGKAIEVPLPGGGTQGKPIGLKPSGGWGTVFDSEPNDRYELTVEILEPIRPSVPTRVVIVGFDRG